MISSQFVVSVLFASGAVAIPQNGYGYGSYGNQGNQFNQLGNNPVSLPPSGLAAPASNLSLKHVLLGYGTQNYTCRASAANAPPASNGAKADLYDVTPLLSKTSGQPQLKLEQELPILALRLGEKGYTPDKWPQNDKPAAVGNHFFAPGLIPIFSLFGTQPSAQIGCKKLANVSAPVGAYAGSQNEGAVDWLQLGDGQPTYTSGNLAGGNVYRVETAGGKAPASCIGQTTDVTVKYAALYFFYGPN